MSERESDLPIYRKRDRHQQAQIVVRVPIELRDQAEAFAVKNGRTLAQEVRRALRMYLEQFDSSDVVGTRQPGARWWDKKSTVAEIAREHGIPEHNQGQMP